jgi:3-isopropylmalate/(R)-2-methylmalate dehydratase large subunit
VSLTLFRKIWNAHRIADIADGALVLIDRVLLHERTGGVALRSLVAAGRQLAAPDSVFATMDHVVDTRPGRTDETIMPTGRDFIRATRAEAIAAGIRLFDIGDPGQGIVHVISPEQGIVLPGLTLVCPDSHTGTQGGLGALAWGIGSTEAEHALATRTLRVKLPKTMRITIDGRLQAGVTAKDLALALIARFGARGGAGHVIEFAGETIRSFATEARMTLCNMATEFGAFTALIAPDEATIDYLRGRPFAPTDAAWDTAVASWRGLVTDAGAQFDAELAIDADEVSPMISWGTNPAQSLPISGVVPADADPRATTYMGLEPGERLLGQPIDGAFIGSCTNSRVSDLRRAAALLRGRRVAPGVRAICVPGSSAVKLAAEEEGIDRLFLAAGFEWRESGCSMCFYSGGESFGPGQRVISSTNRNFESRQGPGTRTHIASPETVVASALAGHIADPREIAR